MISPRAIEVGARALAQERDIDFDIQEKLYGKESSNFTRHEIDAEVTAVLTALAAEGMVVAPLVPTPEMQIAGARSIGKTASMPNHLPRAAACYVEMINAAQPAKDTSNANQ